MKQLLLYIFVTIYACSAIAQNVGIGTTAPQSKLHIHGGNDIFAALQITNNTSGQSSNNGMTIGFQYQGLGTGNNYGSILVKNPETNLRLATNNRFNDLVIFQDGNVGIGTSLGDKSAILYLNSTNSGLRLPNLTIAQRLGISVPAEGLIVYDTDLKGLSYRTNNRWLSIDSANSYWQRVGFGNMKSILPKVLINTNSFGNGADFSLTVGGTVAILNTTGGAASQAALLIADTLSASNQGVGLFLQKITGNNSNNFFDAALDGNLSQVRLQGNLKNGTAANTIPEIRFDSTGYIGIGDNIGARRIRNSLHVFGNQNIEGLNAGTALLLHGPDDNYTSGSELRFQYNSNATVSAGPIPIRVWYTLKHENSNDANVDRQNSIALIKNQTNSVNPFLNQRYSGLVLNDLSQVGIRKYPSKAASNIDVDIEGYTRINGGIQFTGIGEATGKLLVSSSTGDGTWQNPSTITLDQTINTGISQLVFRNGGNYRGAFGWSQTDGRFFFYDGESNTNTLFINDGRLGVQRDATTNALEVNGNASKSTAGSWLGNSDARLKSNILPIESSLEKLMQLKGITYLWKDDKTGYKRPEGVQYGFTAQNIQQVFPELVTTDVQGYLQTAYGTYDPMIIEALRELKKENDELKKEIENIKALIRK